LDKIINEKNKKVHYLAPDDAHQTLCGMSDNGVAGYEKPLWTKTDATVSCKLCLKKLEKLGSSAK
jgi:hypothetical protein